MSLGSLARSIGAGLRRLSSDRYRGGFPGDFSNRFGMEIITADLNDYLRIYLLPSRCPSPPPRCRHLLGGTTRTTLRFYYRVLVGSIFSFFFPEPNYTPVLSLADLVCDVARCEREMRSNERIDTANNVSAGPDYRRLIIVLDYRGS